MLKYTKINKGDSAMKIFSERLKQARIDKGIRQYQLAKLVYPDNPSHNISHYESTNREPDLEHLCRMADVLDCTTDYLLGRTESKNPIKQDFLEASTQFKDRYDNLDNHSKLLISTIFNCLYQMLNSAIINKNTEQIKSIYDIVECLNRSQNELTRALENTHGNIPPLTLINIQKTMTDTFATVTNDIVTSNIAHYENIEKESSDITA